MLWRRLLTKAAPSANVPPLAFPWTGAFIVASRANSGLLSTTCDTSQCRQQATLSAWIIEQRNGIGNTLRYWVTFTVKYLCKVKQGNFGRGVIVVIAYF